MNVDTKNNCGIRKFPIDIKKYLQTPFAQEIKKFFQSIEDSDLLKALRATRWTGRPGYSLEIMWRINMLRFHFGIPTCTGILRRLKSNPYLCYLCKINSYPDGIPSRWMLYRFLKKLEKFHESASAIIAKAYKQLAQTVPEFGEKIAIDSTPVHAYSRPRQGFASDSDAKWGYEKDRYGNTRSFFGYKVHLAVDATYQVPIGVKIEPANKMDSQMAVPLLRNIKRRGFAYSPSFVIADKGYDANKVYEEINLLDAAPIIPMNPRRLGSDYLKNRPRFRLDKPRVPKNEKTWELLYKKRTSIERCNAMLKEHRNLDRLYIRGISGVRIHVICAVLAELVLQAWEFI